MMNPLAVQFMLELAGRIAVSEGIVPERELGYLSLLSNMLRAGQNSNAAMTQLRSKYQAEVASGKPPTLDEVEAIDAETQDLFEKIRNS